jgi:hypothetical protein
MKPEIKEKWLAALRSGEYEQVKGYLAVEVGDNKKNFCCLGVLCDLAIKDGLEISVKEVQGTEDEWVYSYHGATVALPNKVREWAGLLEVNPRVDVSKHTDRREINQLIEKSRKPMPNISMLNDDASWDFNQIADIIEEQL